MPVLAYDPLAMIAGGSFFLVSSVVVTVSQEFDTALLDLDDHSEIIVGPRAFEVELNHVDPLLEKVATADFITAKTYSSESSEACAIAWRDSRYQKIEVMIPSHHNCGQAIADGRDDWVRNARWEKISDKANLMSPLTEHRGD